MGYNVSKAIDMMKDGHKMRHGSWGPTDPSFLVFVPGRVVTASFEPMSALLGDGTNFNSLDHVDAVYATKVDGKYINVSVTLGYQFKQSDILLNAWFPVE